MSFTLLFKKYNFLLFLAFLALSACNDISNVDEARQDQVKDFPKREDNWFERNIPNYKDDIDPYGDLSREDYMDIGNQRKFMTADKDDDSALSDLRDLLLNDNVVEDSELSDKIVSIAVNGDVNVRDVIIELAKRAEVDVQLDNNISGNIILIAKERPFSEIIKRICDQANLVFTYENKLLHIKKDVPVIKNYKFALVDTKRSSKSSIDSSLSVGGNAENGNATQSSGSSSNLTIESGDGDVWANIEKGIVNLLNQYSDTALTTNGVESKGLLSVNRNAGVVSVIATNKQHKEIKKFLDELHISLTSQVLIEAKVLEVTLNDQYSSGINWGLLNNSANGSYIGANFGNATASGAYDANNNFLVNGASSNQFKFSVLPQDFFGTPFDIDASVELLESFGVTRSISNPRISTLNNNYAILNFSENEVYFQVDVEREEQENSNGGTDTVLSVTSEVKSVPIGIVLSIQPSIDIERNEITMNIRPTLTRITDRVENPGTVIAAKLAEVSSSTLNADIPVVEVREMDTVMRMQSGQVMVMGGLLQERVLNTDKGVPGLSRISYIGNAFKGVDKSTAIVETVIFIKATIIPGRGVSIEDKQFYKKFDEKRRTY